MNAADRAARKLLPSMKSESEAGWSFVSAEETVEAAIARVQDLADVRGVELFVQCGGGGLRGDAEALAAALGDVVLAAIEVTSAAGAVFVATYRTADGSQFWTVQDTGAGLPPRQWALALAVARDIVERHGGQMRIDAAPGSGTLVSIAWGSRAVDA
jgi:signal transduction histidine kinase